jgi:RNAse (barnase) inhibitor barstar
LEVGCFGDRRPADSPQESRRASFMPLLEREEYIEQEYFFRTLAERMRMGVAVQELLDSLRDEALSTTKLPLAIGFLGSELRLCGVFSTAMAKLAHYFTPFQTFIIAQAEDERGRFDLRLALEILRREAGFRAQNATPQGVFFYQFEVLCHNRLSYDRGLEAMAADPIFDGDWSEWILTVRRQVGIIDIADLVYVRSAYYRQRKAARLRGAGTDAPEDVVAEKPVLFGEKEGRIALANRRKDPALLFASLQRHLAYPAVPRPEPHERFVDLLPSIVRRLERVETRLKLLEEEQKGGIDLHRFYGPDARAFRNEETEK